jgi:hypothetical protein
MSSRQTIEGSEVELLKTFQATPVLPTQAVELHQYAAKLALAHNANLALLFCLQAIRRLLALHGVHAGSLRGSWRIEGTDRAFTHAFKLCSSVARLQAPHRQFSRSKKRDEKRDGE